MSRRHADNWSQPGHYLVDPYTWPWSPNGHGHSHEWPTATPFVQCQSALPFWGTVISKFDHENPWSRSCVVKGQGHIWPWQFKRQGRTHWSHLRPGDQSLCLLFVSRQSDHFWLRYSKFYICPWKFKVKVIAKVKSDGHIWGLKFNQYIVICFVAIGPFLAEIYSKFHIWPWKFRVKVMAKVTPDGHIWGLEFKWYVCFSFRVNRTIFGWDIANSIFDLENSRSRSRPRSNPMVTFEA